MDETSFQELAWWLVSAILMFVAILGYLPPLAGRYRENDRAVLLWHAGPLVLGRAQVTGGTERYLGFACLGRVLLRRHDHGLALLMSRGFSRDEAASNDGLCTGVFRMRRQGRALVGNFYGRRFSGASGRLLPTETLTPMPRRWHLDPVQHEGDDDAA